MTPGRDAPASPSAVVLLPDDRLGALRRGYDAVGNRRRLKLLAGLAVLVLLAGVSARIAEIDPVTMWLKFGGFTSYFDRLATLDSGARVWTDPVEWFWGLKKWSLLLGQTLLMAYVGTLWGAVFAAVLCFAASRTTRRDGRVRFAALRFLEFCRTVPVLVFALIFVVAFGLGALPGVLALAVHTAGSLGKLFTEVVENADGNPAEGVRASGGSGIQAIRFGVLPQVLSSFASYTLLRFEINLRDATVMGFVGAGGIGEELLVAIRRFYYSDVSAMLVLIVLTVVALDLMTERLRGRLFPGEAR
ncbi:phosphonate ABC transporter, permease protein PhnE [Lichenibacterium ramalinae]|uniref:Phosphonate ABC transporter, permease protein PhnE n=1 Tax=Lichenibacterium ramalinae TaxID=2316527 RepID=A0A4Q2RH68_9HYPH|nr:phosphonate ABC transporter, permease protein PhnE [Lichenibacterium ramalinae]RYB07585.1 phosphonate ABC transporter, permease protein PhnE [Lichenibacterium ramalinae]